MRIQQSVVAATILAALVCCGCRESESVVATAAAAAASDIPAADEKPAEAPVQQEQQDETKADQLLRKATDIFKQATDSEGEGTEASKQWILDKINEANEQGSVVSDDASGWANKVFSTLKDQGLTGAGDAQQWLTEDIRNMNAYKYKVVKVSLNDLEAVEEEMNKLGQLRWECFHASDKGGDTILFFKKQRRSILKNIPVKDMLKLIPLMGGDE